jgi:V8-like Glu-specific endopeptidase
VKTDASVSKGDWMPGFVPDNVPTNPAKTELVVAKDFEALAKKNLPRQVLLRHQVTNERDFPFRAIGKVFIGHTNANNESILDQTGSGALVGPNFLITAGHLIPWGQNRLWIKFVPAFRPAPRSRSGIHSSVMYVVLMSD